MSTPRSNSARASHSATSPSTLCMTGCSADSSPANTNGCSVEPTVSSPSAHARSLTTIVPGRWGSASPHATSCAAFRSRRHSARTYSGTPSIPSAARKPCETSWWPSWIACSTSSASARACSSSGSVLSVPPDSIAGPYCGLAE